MTAAEPGDPSEVPADGGVPAAAPPPRPGRAGARWWLLALAAVVAGAALGVVVARVTMPAAPDPASAQPLPGGYFTRQHGPQAPPWQLPNLSRPSAVVSLAQFRGHPLVLNFWASWCPPCRAEMPALERVSRLLAGRVGFAGLDTNDERGAGLAFARRTGVSYPLATGNAQVYGSYGINGLPTTFFISADGVIAGRQVGGMTQAGLETLIHQVVGITVPSR